MLQYLKENKHVIMIAITLFVLSMSSVFFFFGPNGDVTHKDVKTDLLEGSQVTESINVKSLQEQEKNYRKLVNNQEDNVFVMNIDGTITFTSWNIENSLGYTQQELDHQIFYPMIQADDLSTFMAAFGQVIKNKKPVVNVGPYRLRNKAGVYRTHIASLVPVVTHGNVEEIVIASKEIDAVPKGKKIINETDGDHARFLAENPKIN